MGKSINTMMNVIIVMLVGLFLSSCATSPASYRGHENWGAVLGYTTQDLRAMNQEQFQEAYAKSKAAADANADWARSEALWNAPSKKGSKSLFGNIVNVFEKTIVGVTNDIGSETRRQIKTGIRK